MKVYGLIKERLRDFLPEIRSVVDGERIPLGQASAANATGVYVLYDESGNVVYVGQAAGRAGLKDRFGKHISGDKSHAAQRALLAKIPEKPERNKYIREDANKSLM